MLPSYPMVCQTISMSGGKKGLRAGRTYHRVDQARDDDQTDQDFGIPRDKASEEARRRRWCCHLFFWLAFFLSQSSTDLQSLLLIFLFTNLEVLVRDSYSPRSLLLGRVSVICCESPLTPARLSVFSSRHVVPWEMFFCRQIREQARHQVPSKVGGRATLDPCRGLGGKWNEPVKEDLFSPADHLLSKVFTGRYWTKRPWEWSLAVPTAGSLVILQHGSGSGPQHRLTSSVQILEI